MRGPVAPAMCDQGQPCRIRLILLAAVVILAIVPGCSDGATGGDGSESPLAPPTPTTEVDPEEALAAGCANVVGVEVEPVGDTFRFDVTVRSADTGPEKYADAWEIRTPDGQALGVRELLHDHVGEQPFTRSLTGVVIPEGVDRVVVAARDSEAGFCGQTIVAVVPRG